jgi:hypothetical protein
MTAETAVDLRNGNCVTRIDVSRQAPCHLVKVQDFISKMQAMTWDGWTPWFTCGKRFVSLRRKYWLVVYIEWWLAGLDRSCTVLQVCNWVHQCICYRLTTDPHWFPTDMTARCTHCQLFWFSFLLWGYSMLVLLSSPRVCWLVPRSKPIFSCSADIFWSGTFLLASPEWSLGCIGSVPVFSSYHCHLLCGMFFLTLWIALCLLVPYNVWVIRYTSTRPGRHPIQFQFIVSLWEGWSYIRTTEVFTKKFELLDIEVPGA